MDTSRGAIACLTWVRRQQRPFTLSLEIDAFAGARHQTPEIPRVGLVRRTACNLPLALENADTLCVAECPSLFKVGGGVGVMGWLVERGEWMNTESEGFVYVLG